MLTKRNIDLIKVLDRWLSDLEEQLADKADIMFLHLDVDAVNYEMITKIKVSCDDRELQRSKQKTA